MIGTEMHLHESVATQELRQPSPTWWQEAVIYQIYPRSFCDSDGDGNGDLVGILSRIDYLDALGIDAVWLSPIYPSPLRDNGYDVADHCAVHPMFGTLENFDDLRAALSANSMRLILDFVPNHTSNVHPWFVQAHRSRNDPKRNWYIWRDPSPDGGPPNNWLSLFGGPAWSVEPSSGQFYCHSFMECQPDLNWSHSAVRRAMLDVLRFWLERGVAGFRVDAVGLIAKDPNLADDPPNPLWREGSPLPERVLRTHSGNGSQLIEYLREMRNVLTAFPGDPVLIGESYDPLPELARLYGLHGDGLHLPMNMSLVVSDWSAPTLARLIRAATSDLPTNAWPTWIFGNHDVSRIATRLGDAQARVAMVLLLTLRGTPFIYAGDELGLVDVPPDGSAHDPIANSQEHLRSRDPQRTPMPWDEGQNAGFSRATPWLPVGALNATKSIAAQCGREGSMLELTRALTRLRRREHALRRGDLIDLYHDRATLAFTRAWRGRRLRIILNLTGDPVPAMLPEPGVIILSSVGRLVGPVEGEMILGANEAIIVTPIATSECRS